MVVGWRGAGVKVGGMQDFKRLQIWQRGHALSIAVQKLSRRRRFRGYSVVKGQLIRAADSVPTNIAEGCGADSRRDFAKYLDSAIKSLSETESHLTTAKDLELIPLDDCRRLTAETIEIRKMTHAYRKKVLRTLDNEEQDEGT
jgi:four helix bundle protein